MHVLYRSALFSVSVIAATCALAQAVEPVPVLATRTWVASFGADDAPCTRSQPCRNLSTALQKTAAAGEINVVDSAGFGNVTITKAITISAQGVTAGAHSKGTSTIVVNAGAGDVVYLNGLDLGGAGDASVTSGISFVSGGALHVDNAMIHGFKGQGIDFAPSTNAELYVSNTSLRDNAGGAIWVHAAPGGSARGVVSNVIMAGNGRGVRVEDASVMLVRNSIAAGSATTGFNVVSTSLPAMLTLENDTSTENQTGVRASGAGAVLRLNGNTIVANVGAGLSAAGGGSIVSFGNNRVSGNAGGNGAPTATETSM